jgi:hypothetical protein
MKVRNLQCTVWVPDAEASGLGDQSPLKGACVGADPCVCPGRTQGFAPTARFHLLSRRLQASVVVIALDFDDRRWDGVSPDVAVAL